MAKNDWYEMPSYSYPAEPGTVISECLDCSHWWRCAIESDERSPTQLAIREWHTAACIARLEAMQGDDDKQ